MVHPVATNSKEYKRMSDKWRRCRDVCAGSDAVKEAGTRYLPMLGLHKVAQDGAARYAAYKDRALFYNATRRTKIGLTGAATHKDPDVVTSSPQALAFANKIIRLILEPTVSQQLEVSHLAILVDKKDDELEPSFSIWEAESIVNTRFITKDSANVLSLLVLEQLAEVPTGDIFKYSEKLRRHVYWLEPSIAPDGTRTFICMYEVFEHQEKSDTDEEDWISILQPLPILVNGLTIDHIPAVIVGVTDINKPVIEDPLLLDMADVNISHYHNSADLEHGRHWTALPTAFASGFPTKDADNNDIDLVIGSESAWVTDIPGASCGYMEFTGAGLGHLADGMKDKQTMMAVLGARLLEEAKPAVEASETIKTRMLGDKSSLTYVATTASKALTWVLQELLRWSNPLYVTEEGKDTITLDTSFIDPKLSANEVTQLVLALQNNAISYMTFFWCLQRGGIIPPERTIDEEREFIKAGKPVGPANQDLMQVKPNTSAAELLNSTKQ